MYGEIVLNTVYSLYMYEHVVIHVPCREATYIHHFYSSLSLLLVCRLIFTCLTILATELDTCYCLQDTCGSATVHVNQLTDCEHGGNIPLTMHTVYDLYF